MTRCFVWFKEGRVAEGELTHIIEKEDLTETGLCIFISYCNKRVNSWYPLSCTKQLRSTSLVIAQYDKLPICKECYKKYKEKNKA